MYASDISSWCNIDFTDNYSNPLYYAKKLYSNNELVTELVIPANTIEVKSYAFYNCSSINSVELPKSVISIGTSAFYGCTGLMKVINNSSLTIEQGSTSNGYIAYYAGEIIDNTNNSAYADFEFEVIDGVNTLVKYSGEGELQYETKTFEDWTSTNKSSNSESSHTYTFDVEVGSILTFDWKVGSEYDYDWLIINLDKNNVIKRSGSTSGSYEKVFTEAGTHELVVKYTKDGSASEYADEGKIYNITLTNKTKIPADVILPENYEGEAYVIGAEAFIGNKLISSVTFSEGVTGIGKYAFYGCTNIASIGLSNSISTIGEFAFAYCENLTEIEIPESVTSIESGTFAYCKKLANVKLPNTLTRIGILSSSTEGAFENCESLIGIEIPNSVTVIGSTAFTRTGLKSITIPKSVTNIGYYAFNECNNMESIIVEDGNTTYDSRENCSALIESANNALIVGCNNTIIPSSITSISDCAFKGCSALASVEIPNGVTTIGTCTFEDCSSLTSIEIPGSVARIEGNAFKNCGSLTTITIPENSQLTSIGSCAFFACNNLSDVYCYAITPPSAGNDVFSNLANVTLYVLTDALESYKTTSPWSNFGKIVPESVIISLNQYGSGTYCSDYALDFSEVEGLKAYAATGFNTETGIVTLTRVMTAKPGMGLFIKGEPGEYTVPTMEKTNDNSLNMLVGTLEDVTVGKLSSGYANYKYTIKAGDVEPMFHNFDDGFALSAGKAYLQIPVEWFPAAMEARSIGIRFDDGDGATDIDNAEIRNQKSEIVYDLMGRRVASPKKGELYIIDGKKVIY